MATLKRLLKFLLVGTVMFLAGLIVGLYAYVGAQMHDPSTMSYLVLRPVTGASSDPDVLAKSQFVTAADGNKLHVVYFQNPAASRLVIVSHGNAGNLSNRIPIAKALMHAGCSVILYDYRGYGLSTGTPSIFGLLHDSLTRQLLRQSTRRTKLFELADSAGITVRSIDPRTPII